MIGADKNKLKIEMPTAIKRGNTKLVRLKDVEKNHIHQVLMSVNWKVSGKGGAAESLDIHPNTLIAKMKKLGLKNT